MTKVTYGDSPTGDLVDNLAEPDIRICGGGVARRGDGHADRTAADYRRRAFTRSRVKPLPAKNELHRGFLKSMEQAFYFERHDAVGYLNVPDLTNSDITLAPPDAVVSWGMAGCENGPLLLA